MPEQSERYAREKFYNAVQSLASNDSSLRERLEFAAVAVHTLRSSDFRTEFGERFSKLWSSLTKDSAEDESEGKIKATIRNMNDGEARAAAQEFVDILVELYGGL